jgi:cell division protein FtsW
VDGAKRWVSLGFMSFQPSEIAKIGLIIFYASLLTKNKDRLHEMGKGFFYPLLFILPVIAILVGVQNHLSATILIVMIVSVMMLMAGTRLRYFLTFGTAGAATGVTALFLYAKMTGKGLFRITRLITFLDPFADVQGTGWQVIQSLYAIGSGGLFGVGLGNSTQKYLYLPEAHNDFIFSIIAEELGFVGCIFVMILFALFIWRGILIAIKAPDMFGSLIAVGITTMIGLQAIINIAVVTSSMPNTGMPLPFFSYGGTSLLILMASVGVLLNISRVSKSK